MAVTVGSLLPGDSLPFEALPNDKLLHFSAYIVLGALPLFCTERKRTGIVLVLAVPVLGAILEAVQQVIPGRSAEFGDLAANTLGTAAGCGLGVGLRLVSGQDRGKA